MGATLGALQSRGLVARGADPQDRRRVVLSVTDAGLQVLRQLMVAAPLIERLAQSL
jgi:DNA-binding MarR family transcriptional regulator